VEAIIWSVLRTTQWAPIFRTGATAEDWQRAVGGGNTNDSCKWVQETEGSARKKGLIAGAGRGTKGRRKPAPAEREEIHLIGGGENTVPLSHAKKTLGSEVDGRGRGGAREGTRDSVQRWGGCDNGKAMAGWAGS